MKKLPKLIAKREISVSVSKSTEINIWLSACVAIKDKAKNSLQVLSEFEHRKKSLFPLNSSEKDVLMIVGELKIN